MYTLQTIQWEFTKYWIVQYGILVNIPNFQALLDL